MNELDPAPRRDAAMAAGVAVTPDLNPVHARALLSDAAVEALEVSMAIRATGGYRRLAALVTSSAPFMCDFSGQSIEAVLFRLADRICLVGLEEELWRLTADLERLRWFGMELVQGTRVLMSIRNWFAPGDLVWHVDRSAKARAFRILWPIGRAAGMKVTTKDNIDLRLYNGFMQREHPLLCKLDRKVVETGRNLESLWAHRPKQMNAMICGNYPFLKDPGKVYSLHRDSIAVHRIETPDHCGTWHRSSWENRRSPGLQVIVTATS